MKKKDIILGILFSLLYYLIIYIVLMFLSFSGLFDVSISELSSKMGFVLGSLFPLLLLLSPLLIKFIFKRKLYQSVLYSLLFFIIFILIYYGTKQILMNRIIVDEYGGVGEGAGFNGENYDLKSFTYTGKGKLIGTAGGWKVFEVPEDKEHNFIIFHSFLDHHLVVRSTYIIPKSGNIGVVYFNNYRYTDDDIKTAIKYLINENLGDGFNITTNNIYSSMTNIYIGYEDCPVGTEDAGKLGYINNKLSYIKPIEYNYNNYEELGEDKDEVYTCYIVPEKYINAFKKFKYIHETNMNIDK